MLERLKRSWQLIKASWAVLRTDKELILFPIMSGVVMIITTITFFLPASIIFGLMSGGRDGETTSSILGVVGMFIYYLISYTIITYFNVGLVGAAMIRLDGGDPTLREGLRIANERLNKIVVYAAISATVGTILQMLRERGGIIGSIVGSLGGLAWNLASFFVVPILVLRDVSPWEAVKESTSLLKKTWGEQVIAGSGMGIVFTFLSIAIVIVGVFLVVALSSISGTLAAIGVVALVLALLTLGVISSALNGIFQAVMYRYVEYGTAPTDYDIESLRGVFQDKNKNKN